MGHQRKGSATNVDAGVYLPNQANATTYAAMKQSDADLRGVGYALHLARAAGGHNTAAAFGPSTQIHLTSPSAEPRDVTVNYRLTLAPVRSRPGSAR